MIPKGKYPNEQIVSEWILKTMASFHLLFGNYITILDSKPLSYITKIYCICFCSTVISIFFTKVYEKVVFSAYFICMIEYACTSFINLIYGNKLYRNFFGVIKINDRIIGFKKMSLITIYTYFIIVGNTVMRLILSVVHGLPGIRSLPGYFSVFIAVSAMDLNYLIVIVIFSLIQNRMKHLRRFLASNSIPITITGRNEVAISIQNVRKSLLYYNNLLDNLESIDQQLQCVLFVNWISNVLREIILGYKFIELYSIGALSSLLLVSMTMEILHTKVMVTSPALIVEVTIYEVEQIKAILTTQILRCSDESLRFELQTALQYVRLRPFRYTLCRAVPLDINLIFTTTALCTTYIIVALQLKHFTV